MAVEPLTSYTWPSDRVPVAGLRVRVADLAANLGLPLATWSVDGLGPASGFGGRLPSGRVVLVEELELQVRYQGAPGPTVYMDATDLGSLGIEPLAQEICDALGLTKADLALVAGSSAHQIATDPAGQVIAARPPDRADATRRPQPDRPVGFGYKVAWLAVATPYSDAAALVLGLRTPRVAPWAKGIEAAYDSSVFVTPPLDGWTLAVGAPLFLSGLSPADNVKPLLQRLSRYFGAAQYFCTHRVDETHVWAAAREGRLLRGYGWSGSQGETLWDEGAPTSAERSLGFRFFDERAPEASDDGYWSRKDLHFPNERCVMQLAGRWSIDPSKLEERFHEPSLGLLGAYSHEVATTEAPR